VTAAIRTLSRSVAANPSSFVLGGRIPIVAAVVGLAGSAVAYRSPATALATSFFFFVLAHVAVIDLRERRIPNAYTYIGTLAAALFALSVGAEAFRDALLGLFAAGGVMSIVYVAGRGSLGLGDVKLSIFAGTVLGIHAVPAFLLLGSLFGALAALYIVVRTRDARSAFAYGPSLALAAAFMSMLQPGGA
jgi:leader peptidase (prepilin peptidase)/N-methyltransferase